MPGSSHPYSSMPHSSDIELQGFEYLCSVSPAGRLLPSSSKWNAIEFDLSILPHSSISGSESLPSRYSKSIDFNLVVTDKTYLKRFIYICTSIILSIIAFALVLHFWPHKHKHDDHSKNLELALNKALLFFDAQKSGHYPKDSLVNFRGGSGTNDGNTSSVKADLVGGFYDSGNNIKFSFTTAYTVTLLSWSVIEYHEKFDQIGELDHIKDIIKWGSDYLLKVFVVPNNNSSQAILFSQVGSSGNKTENDINCWQRPEDMTYPRPVSSCNEAASDLAGEIIAAYSSASIALKDNTEYSKRLIKSAENLFNITTEVDLKQKGDTYTANDECGGEARNFYSSSGYKDELIWGATWLFFTTGNMRYLEYATSNFTTAEKDELFSDKGIFYWNNKLTATQVLLTRIRFFHDLGYPYEDALISATNRTDLLMCSYLSNLHFDSTEGGLILMKPDHSGPLQYAATASFLSKLYIDYLALLQRSGSTCSDSWISLEMMQNFSSSQVNYILGDNPMKMSYIVGYGDKYPNQVHHRAASIPWDGQTYSCEEGNNKFLKSQNPNPNIITGAMVAGPDEDDNFVDIREKGEFTEATIASNAGLVAALVALMDYSSDRFGLGMDKMGMFDNIRDVSFSN